MFDIIQIPLKEERRMHSHSPHFDDGENKHNLIDLMKLPLNLCI